MKLINKFITKGQHKVKKMLQKMEFFKIFSIKKVFKSRITIKRMFIIQLNFTIIKLIIYNKIQYKKYFKASSRHLNPSTIFKISKTTVILIQIKQNNLKLNKMKNMFFKIKNKIVKICSNSLLQKYRE